MALALLTENSTYEALAGLRVVITGACLFRSKAHEWPLWEGNLRARVRLEKGAKVRQDRTSRRFHPAHGGS